MTENESGTGDVDASVLVEPQAAGLLESVYERVQAEELSDRGLALQRQVPVSIHYSDLTFDEDFPADIMVNERVILEL